MPDDRTILFDAGAAAWSDYNQQPLGRIRQEVTWRNLVPYLPPVSDREHRPRVLDAGGGSGELALRLVRRGYFVWLVDSAAAMLAQADQAARSLPPNLRDRLVLENLDVQDADALSQRFARDFFDVVTCHTLVEYLPDPAAVIRSLADLLGGGGLMSISFVNRHAEVLRTVWSRSDPCAALRELEDACRPSDFCASLFGLNGRSYDAEEASSWLRAAGLPIMAVCGIRVFADFLPGERLLDPGFFDPLLRLEVAAASREPYNRLARYLHVIARKDAML